MFRKTIALPGCCDLDIGPILPIVNSEIFQRLRHRKQMGLSHLVFPDANHTRLTHSLRVYARTLERTQHWHSDHSITQEQALNLCLLGLLHDIGHGPYSHATEGLCSIDHNAHGLEILGELAQEIEECGGNLHHIRQLFMRQDPLHVCVSHRPLGTDKLDYLKLDARHTTNAVGFRMEDILNHTYFVEGKLAVHRNIIAEVKQVQHDYVNMHDRVYFRKAAIILQYFLRQIISYSIADGSIQAEQLLNLTDSELDALLLKHPNESVQKQFRKLYSRHVPKTAIVLRPEEVKALSAQHTKPRMTFRVPMDKLMAFANCEDRATASIHETAIAHIVSIPREDVLITPIASPERFVPHNVPIFNGETIVTTLEEVYPEHFKSLREASHAYAAVRVCVAQEHQAKVADPRFANQIFKYLMNSID